MIKLTDFHDNTKPYYINAHHVMLVEGFETHTQITLSTGVLIDVKEKVNRVVDALKVHLKPRG